MPAIGPLVASEMGSLWSELQLRAAAYLYGAGEFAGNVFRNGHARLFPAVEEQHGQDLAGKTCIITGSNAGIGFATAQALCRRGCRVILACRSKERAAQAAERIREGCGGRGEVEVAALSLSSLSSVRAFCADFQRSRRRLDLLILNAGIMGADASRRVTEDGLEEHFQVNYLSHWLLAHRLVGAQLAARDQLSGSKAAAEAGPVRVVFLTSSTHVAGSLDFDDLQLQRRPYSGFRAYTASKLAAILAARQLQAFFDRRPEGCGDAAVAVHPGLVQTSLAHGWFAGSDVASALLQPVAAACLAAVSPAILEPPERAAKTVLFAATAPADQVAGSYVAYGRPRRASARAGDVTVARRLWRASLALCGEQPNEIEGAGWEA